MNELDPSVATSEDDTGADEVFLSLSQQTWSTSSGCSSWSRRGTGMCGWSPSAGRSPTRPLRTSTCGCSSTTPATWSTSPTSWSSSPGCSSSAEETSWSVSSTEIRSFRFLSHQFGAGLTQHLFFYSAIKRTWEKTTWPRRDLRWERTCVGLVFLLSHTLTLYCVGLTQSCLWQCLCASVSHWRHIFMYLTK